jgi:hypothetical protein
MSAVDALAGSVIGATTAPITGVTRSIVDWLQAACQSVGGSDYASCYYLAGLATILFVHYILYILENLSAFQYKAQTWKQAISETRQFLQIGVVRWLIYFSSMIGGLVQGAGSGLQVTMSDLEWCIMWGQFISVVLLINKSCVLLTGMKNFGNTATISTPGNPASSIGYGPLSYYNVTAGAFTIAAGGPDYGMAVNTNGGGVDYVSAPVQPANKPWWVFITWIQTITDILLSNMVYPAVLGYAGGKFARVASGSV